MKLHVLAALFMSMGLLSFRPIPGDQYVSLGQYFAHAQGSASLPLRLPDGDGVYRDWLSWGYPIWAEYQAEPPSEPGWLISEDLTQAPYYLPADATAVRLHLKSKVAGVTWAENQLDGSLQVKLRPHGSTFEPNEVLHSATGKPAGAAGYTPYDLNHVEVDVPIGDGNRIEIYQEASIVGSYMQIDLVVYVAGYWR